MASSGGSYDDDDAGSGSYERPVPQDQYFRVRQQSINVAPSRVSQLRQFFNSIFSIWFQNARRRRKMQFAATLIQWAYRRHLRWVAATEMAAAAAIERTFIKYLCRRNTRTYWRGVDFKTVSRDTIQWVLRAAGKRWEGKRKELEDMLHEYVYEFELITEKAEEERREHLRLTLESTGTIYAWGANDVGQLGDGKNNDTNNPRYNPELAGKGIVRVIAGFENTSCFALAKTGEVYTWGGGGQHPTAGLNKEVLVAKFGEEWYRKPVRVDGGLHNPPDAEEQWAARMIASQQRAQARGGKQGSNRSGAGGGMAEEVVEAGMEESSSQLDKNIVEVALGKEHAVAAISEGGCFSWGQNIYGQTGRPKALEKLQSEPRWVGAMKDDTIVQMAACARCSLAVTATGQLVLWGEGQQTKGTVKDRIVSYPGQRKKPDEKRAFVIPRLNHFGIIAHQVSCGQSHAAVLTSTGQVYTWGDGAGGRLGLGDMRSRKEPCLVETLAARVVLSVSCGVWHSAAIVHVPGVSLPVGAESPWLRTDVSLETQRVSADARRGKERLGLDAGAPHPMVKPEEVVEEAEEVVADDVSVDSFRFVAPPEKSAAEKQRERAMLRRLLGAGDDEDDDVARANEEEEEEDDEDDVNSVADLFGELTTEGLAPRGTPERPVIGGKKARDAWAEEMKVRHEQQHAALQRQLPPLAQCITPVTPAGELYTWGSGMCGQLAQRHATISLVPKPVQWATELEMSRPVVDRIELMGDAKRVPGLPETLEERRRARFKEANKLLREREQYASRAQWGVLPGDQQAWYKRQRRRRRQRLASQRGGGDGEEEDEEEQHSRILVQAVVCGARHCAALCTRGAVFTWGCDQRGCLGRSIQAGLEFRTPPYAGAAFSSTFKAAARDLSQGQREQLIRKQALQRTTQRTYTAMVGSLGAAPFGAKGRKVRRGVTDGRMAALEMSSSLANQLYTRGDNGLVSRSDAQGQGEGAPDMRAAYFGGAISLSSKQGRYLARADVVNAGMSSARTRGSRASAMTPSRLRGANGTAGSDMVVKYGQRIGAHGLPVKPTYYKLGDEHVGQQAWTDPSRLKRPLVPRRGYDRRLAALHRGTGLGELSTHSDGAKKVPSMVEWMNQQALQSQLDKTGGVARPKLTWGELPTRAIRDGAQPHVWHSTAVPGRVQGLAGVYAGRVCSVAVGADFTVAATLPLMSPLAVVPSEVHRVPSADTNSVDGSAREPRVSSSSRSGTGRPNTPSNEVEPLLDPVVAAAKARAKRRAGRRRRRYLRAMKRQRKRERAQRRYRRRVMLVRTRRQREAWKEQRRQEIAARLEAREARHARRADREARRHGGWVTTTIRERLASGWGQCQLVWQSQHGVPLQAWAHLGGRMAKAEYTAPLAAYLWLGGAAWHTQQVRVHRDTLASSDALSDAESAAASLPAAVPFDLAWWLHLGGTLAQQVVSESGSHSSRSGGSSRSSRSDASRRSGGSSRSDASRRSGGSSRSDASRRSGGSRRSGHGSADGGPRVLSDDDDAVAAGADGSVDGKEEEGGDSVGGKEEEGGDSVGGKEEEGGDSVGGKEEEGGDSVGGNEEEGGDSVGGGNEVNAERTSVRSESDDQGSRSDHSGSYSDRSSDRSDSRSNHTGSASGSYSDHSGSYSDHSGSYSDRSGSTSGSGRSWSTMTSTTSGGTLHTGATPESLKSPAALSSGDERYDDLPVDAGSVGTASLHSSDWSSHSASTPSSNTSSDESVFDYTAVPAEEWVDAADADATNPLVVLGGRRKARQPPAAPAATPAADATATPPSLTTGRSARSLRSMPARLPPLVSPRAAAAAGDDSGGADDGEEKGEVSNEGRRRVMSESYAAQRSGPQLTLQLAAMLGEAANRRRRGGGSELETPPPARGTRKRAHRDSALRTAAVNRLRMGRVLRRVLGAGSVEDGSKPKVSPRTKAALEAEADYQRKLMNLRKARARQRKERRQAKLRMTKSMRARQLADALAAGDEIRTKRLRDKYSGANVRDLQHQRAAGQLSPPSSLRSDEEDDMGASGLMTRTVSSMREQTATRTRGPESLRRRRLGSVDADAGSTSGTSVETTAVERRRRVAARRMRQIEATRGGKDHTKGGMALHPFQRVPRVGEVTEEELEQFARPKCRACDCIGYMPNPLNLFRCRLCMHARSMHGHIPLPDAESQRRAVVRIQRMYRNRMPRLLRSRLVSAVASVYIKTKDPTTGLFYYFNTRTNESRWDKPPELQVLEATGANVDIEVTKYQGDDDPPPALEDGNSSSSVSSDGSSDLSSAYGSDSSNGSGEEGSGGGSDHADGSGSDSDHADGSGSDTGHVDGSGVGTVA